MKKAKDMFLNSYQDAIGGPQKLPNLEMDLLTCVEIYNKKILLQYGVRVILLFLAFVQPLLYSLRYGTNNFYNGIVWSVNSHSFYNHLKS